MKHAQHRNKKGEIGKMNCKKPILLMMTLTVTMTLVNSSMFAAFAADMPSPFWRTKAAMPTARGQTATVVGDDGLIYVMGGFAGGAPFNIVQAYNPLTNAWTAKAPMLQVTRGASVAKAPAGIIYVIGGESGVGQLKTVQAYNATSNIWSIKADALNVTWMAGAATSSDGRIILIGGESSGFSSYSNVTQIYNPATDSWTSGADMPTGRSELGVVEGPDGLIYAMGGYNGSTLSVVEAYNPLTDSWITKAPMPTPKLEFGAALGPDGKIYIIGGGTSYGNNVGPFYDTVEIYDPRTDTWSIPGWSESSMPTARKEFRAVAGLNGRIYAIGGANGAYVATNEEANIVLPDNVPPTAYIDSISPNPATRGQTISLTGHGTDSDGSIAAYKWRSSLDGTIGTSATISLSTLSVGTHTMYFSVKDDSDAWSNEAVATVIVNKPITEDPTYQQLVETNDTLNNKISALSAQADYLTQQNTNLADEVTNLTQKLDTTTLMLLATNIVVIVLVVVAIALVFMSRRKPTATT